MKKIAFLLILISLGAANLRADDQVAAVQQELKDQGFYYGQVDGQAGPETTAAIRRYQIRNGLHVDGTLNKETLGSLKIAGTGSSAPSATTAKNQPVPPKPAPLDARTQQAQPSQAQQFPAPPKNIQQSDQEFLSKQDQAGDVASVATPTPAPAPAPGETTTNPRVISAPVAVEPPQEAPPPQPQAPPLGVQYASIFARTPYQNAPIQLQQITVRNAQALLARATYYNGEIDGIPGPLTAQAITAFQANGGLAQTGRLDIETLSALRLLPNQGPVPVRRRIIIQPFFPPPRIVFRGVWVD